jgi:hypothetical protein
VQGGTKCTSGARKSVRAKRRWRGGYVFNVENSPSINISAALDDLGDQIKEVLDDNLEQLFEWAARIADLQSERSAAV